MKKTTKALLLTLCAVLLVAASVMGTVAYLTASDSVKNTFTVGKVKINLDEAKVTEDGKPVGTDRVKANNYKLIPGVTYTKDPTVTILNGSVESYVRMKVTFNNASKILDLCINPEDYEKDENGNIIDADGTDKAFPLIFMVNFTENADMKWDGPALVSMAETADMLKDTKYFTYDATADTFTYTFYYNEKVAAPSGDEKLPVLFDSVTLPNWVTGEQLDGLQNFQISVVAEAIQAEGFTDADAAWEAFSKQA